MTRQKPISSQSKLVELRNIVFYCLFSESGGKQSKINIIL